MSEPSTRVIGQHGASVIASVVLVAAVAFSSCGGADDSATSGGRNSGLQERTVTRECAEFLAVSGMVLPVDSPDKLRTFKWRYLPAFDQVLEALQIQIVDLPRTVRAAGQNRSRFAGGTTEREITSASRNATDAGNIMTTYVAGQCAIYSE